MILNQIWCIIITPTVQDNVPLKIKVPMPQPFPGSATDITILTGKRHALHNLVHVIHKYSFSMA